MKKLTGRVPLSTIMFLAAILSILAAVGCGQAKEPAEDIFSNIPEDRELIWDGKTLLTGDVGISADNKQLGMEDGVPVLTCCASSLSERSDGIRFIIRENGQVEIESPEWLRESGGIWKGF